MYIWLSWIFIICLLLIKLVWPFSDGCKAKTFNTFTDEIKTMLQIPGAVLARILITKYGCH